jgi:solute carrier family 35, member F1/2
MQADGSSSSDTAKKDGEWNSRLKILAFGQVLSLLLAVMWASQSMLYLKCNWNSPAFSCFWAYLLLSIFLVPLIMKGRAIRKGTNTAPVEQWFLRGIPLQASPWFYFGMALLSFYGSYCYLIAVTFTTITSVSLVDAMSIPTAMILSHVYLRRRYSRMHLFGATLCISGVIIGLVIDGISNYIYNSGGASVQVKYIVPGASNATSAGVNDGSKEYPHKLVGDFLSLLGAVLFGTNDVLAELSVRRLGGTTEYLGMVGFFGIFISMFQISITERETVADMFNGVNPSGCSGSLTAGFLVAYVLGQFSRKAGLATFLTISDAALLQLSLLTSDLYTAIFSVLYLHILPRLSSWLAMVLVLAGIVVYETGPSPVVDLPTHKIEDKSIFELDGLVRDESSNVKSV